MFKGLPTTLTAAIPVALLSVAIVYWRGSAPGKTAETAVAKLQAAVWYVVVAVISGFVAKGVYLWVVGRWPATGTSIYFWLAMGLAAALTVLAFVGRSLWKTGDILGYTAINFLWALGYGWLLPRLMS